MNELDQLMNKLREGTPLSNADVDKIIEDQIKRLALYNSGIKPKKADKETADVGETMKKILSTLVIEKPKSTFKRRI